VDVQDIIYGPTISDCISAHPGVANGDQYEPQDEMEYLLNIVEKVEVTKSIPRVDKQLLAAGLKVSVKIDDFSYFFKSRTMIGL
jgi:hypothetical protein